MIHPAEIFSKHERAVLFFSGGKDSLACLLLLEAYWDRLTVVWVNEGAPHPETVEYMMGIAGRVPDFVELRGNQPEWIKQHGWPVDVLPVRASTAGELGAGAGPLRFQSFMTCCEANLWKPMTDYVAHTKPSLLIGGQRRGEPLRNHTRNEELQMVEGGIEYWQPLNDWTTEQVFEYIKEQGEPLPPFYADGATSSPDCWNCTAYLDHNAGRLSIMRKQQPQHYAIVEAVLKLLARRLHEETAPMFKLLGETNG